MNSIYEQILSEVEKMPVIDTHEHLTPFDNGEHPDVLVEYLAHYMSADLISSGLSQEDMDKVINPEIPIAERWKTVEPYWEYCRYTGYGRALDIAVKGIYGIDGINGNTIEVLNKAFKKENKPGHFKHVLKDLCNIRISILDAWDGKCEGDRELFRRVWQPQKYVTAIPPGNPETIEWLKSKYGIEINSIDDWMKALRAELDYNLDNGIIALKCTLAYSRSLKFNKVEYDTAKSAFDLALEKWNKEGRTCSIELPIEVQDFMMHYILSLADEKHLVFQFHTGLQEGNGNIITNSDPSLMAPLFMEYKNVTFDLFHISYPFQGMASTLAKNFPNVYIDMCWAHIISPSACVNALSDFLDAVPYNKISGFGGDYILVDGVYGHLYIAKRNISRTLAQKVQEGVFDIKKAIEIARCLLHDNPYRIFRLEKELQ